MLVDVDAEACGQLAHLPLEVGLQVVVVQVHDVEIVGGVPERLQVFSGAAQRRPDLRGRRLVVDPLPEAGPLAVGRGCRGRNGPSSMPSIAAAWSRAMRNTPKSMLSMWWSIDRATSRGSRPTQM